MKGQRQMVFPSGVRARVRVCENRHTYGSLTQTILPRTLFFDLFIYFRHIAFFLPKVLFVPRVISWGDNEKETVQAAWTECTFFFLSIL